jgi:hypothetical protein
LQAAANAATLVHRKAVALERRHARTEVLGSLETMRATDWLSQRGHPTELDFPVPALIQADAPFSSRKNMPLDHLDRDLLVLSWMR